MMLKSIAALGLFVLSCFALPAFAHHSFPVHFVPEEMVTVTGVVKEFHFTNPHGVVYFTVTDKDGKETEWRAETNSPNLLKRRGWSKDSLVAGQKITVEGWPARDRSPLLRIATITLPDGSVLTGQQSRAPTTAED